MLFETSVVIGASFQNRPLSGSNQYRHRNGKPKHRSIRVCYLESEKNRRNSKAIEHPIALAVFYAERERKRVLTLRAC